MIVAYLFSAPRLYSLMKCLSDRNGKQKVEKSQCSKYYLCEHKICNMDSALPRVCTVYAVKYLYFTICIQFKLEKKKNLIQIRLNIPTKFRRWQNDLIRHFWRRRVSRIHSNCFRKRDNYSKIDKSSYPLIFEPPYYSYISLQIDSK